MKKITKILTVVLLVAMILTAVSPVFASGVLKEIEDAANNATVNTAPIAKTVGTIVAYLRNAAVIIGVVIIIILGIKYMTGSVEEKAGYQKSFVPLIIGIVIVMAATSIAAFLFDILG